MTRFITALVLMVFVVGIGFLAVSARDMRSHDGTEPAMKTAENREKAPPFDGTGCSNTSFGVHRTNQVEATFNCLGTFGSGFQWGLLVPADTGNPELPLEQV